MSNGCYHTQFTPNYVTVGMHILQYDCMNHLFVDDVMWGDGAFLIDTLSILQSHIQYVAYWLMKHSNVCTFIVDISSHLLVTQVPVLHLIAF